jgi:hypothetical protein
VARKTEIVRVPKEWGKRDADKHFLITEWDADHVESWGIKLALACARSRSDLPQNITGIGWEGVALLGINVFLRGDVDAAEITPIFNELLECVKMVRDPQAYDKNKGGPVVTDIVSPDDIEEVATRLWLRSEVLRVTLGFSPADVLSHLWTSVWKKTAEETSPNT